MGYPSYMHPSSRRGVLTTMVVAIAVMLSACASAPQPTATQAPAIPLDQTDARRWIGPLQSQGGNPELVACRPQQVWDVGLRDAAKDLAQETLAAMAASGLESTGKEAKQLFDQVESMAMWALVRRLLLGGSHHNFGGFPLKGVTSRSGVPVIVYRTGVTADPSKPGSCVHSLLRHGQVRHIVNLYAGPMPTSDLEEAERQAVNEVKGTYFLARTGAPAVSEWREHLREHGESATEEVSRTVAQIINELILSPEGAPLQGNIHLHCGGGMHRTGMIMGIMDRCINGTAYPIIEADYKRHVAWRSDERTGGFEQANLDFITSFDCGLIKTPQ